jgi:large subunit ribosomal protein L29
MAIMKINDIRNMKTEDLLNKLEELRKELIIKRSFAKRKAKMENPKEIKEIRRTIARVLTELNQRKIKIEN